jgi:hypothetical protein
MGDPLGLDSLAVIMIDVPSIDKLFTARQQMDYLMGASRAGQLLAIIQVGEASRVLLFQPG